LNLDEILLLVPDKYQGVQNVFLFVGLAKLCDVASGVNGAIISTSDRYRFDLYINAFLIVSALVTNMIFIPKYGIEGAAFATFISVFLYNLVKWFLLKRWYQFQPFDKRFVVVLLLSILIVYLDSFIAPFSEFIILQIAIKSLLISLLYLVPILALKLSPDINEWIAKHLKKIKHES
jgi:O-antigen/teichoic acid export membrane protein